MKNSFFAQIKKDDLTHLKLLPDVFKSENLTNGLTVAFGIAGGIALIIVVYGGFKYVLSQGNPQETTKAKDTILNGMIGLVVIIISGSIVALIVTKLT